MKNKFWGLIEEKLKCVEDTLAYYVGGTLFIRYRDKNEVALNLSGKGFLLLEKTPEFMKDSTIYPPEYITKLVRKLYIKYKGKTSFYKECLKEK